MRAAPVVNAARSDSRYRMDSAPSADEPTRRRGWRDCKGGGGGRVMRL